MLGQALVQRVRQEIGVYRRVLHHPQTPPITRWLLRLALVYLLTPIDLIPDIIPIIGHLDDLVIVPLLLILAVQMIPQDILDECHHNPTPDNDQLTR